MKILLALLFAVMLAATASAVPENATTGPYVVSFDLNGTLNYRAESVAPIEEEIRTAYPLTIAVNSSPEVQITIFEYKNLVDSTPDLWQTINSQGLALLHLRNISLAPGMVIDGIPAYGLSAIDSANRTLYSSYYWLDSNECECGPVSLGKTNVVITSTLPLNITGQLLDTLHVEKNLGVAGPMTFAPPKA
jgi:hypothetical protein